ncbi:hypothetical protein [Halorussus marinus]|uniref:hypothetical protein n=2 Tax=Halorussus marinus TaxID=2505976 RepID=UPI00109268B8|nr:hypothetical protein [Halorussus marinus]
MSTRERRVTLALKWHYLDNLSVEEIQDRFEDEGVGSYAKSTIRGYLNEEPKEEVIEQIEQKHADVRLQIAEREERLYQRARNAESQAVEDQPIVRVVPKTETVSNDRETPMSWPAWEIVEPGDDDWPEWATERDVIIRFVDNEQTRVLPGEEYPLRAIDGSPKYTKELAGLERDQPDLKGQAMARQEQSSHLEAKGEALGIYSTDINMQVDGDVDHSVELDAETAAAIREATLDDE